MAKLSNWVGLPSILLILLLAIPIALLLNVLSAGALPIFIAAAIGIAPLAGMLGEATETVAHKIGPRFGGLLNATLGNATEIIISIFALKSGLVTVVLASITGSILGNLLLVLGMSLLAGGIKHGIQKFDQSNAKTDATLLIMVVIALGIPSIFNFEIEPDVVAAEQLSIGVAITMLVLYGLYLLFSMTNERVKVEEEQMDEQVAPAWSTQHAVVIMIIAVVLIAILSEVLVGAIEGLTDSLGWSEFFIGIIIIPIIGNAAEHSVAIEQAMKNQMDLSLSIAIGSSLQIALFVAPILVFISLLAGNPMRLEFNVFEIAALMAASFIAAIVSLDGESNWFEGVMLLIVYVILAIGFFFL